VNECGGVVLEQRQRASGVVVDRDLGEVHLVGGLPAFEAAAPAG
jgi:hypothetical protein